MGKEERMEKRKKQKVKLIVNCVIEGTWNNVFVTVYIWKNKILVKGSIGLTGNWGTKKKSEVSAIALGMLIGKKIVELGYRSIKIKLSGCWRKGENGCIKGLKNSEIKIQEIDLLRKCAHNGVWGKKVKRK